MLFFQYCEEKKNAKLVIKKIKIRKPGLFPEVTSSLVPKDKGSWKYDVSAIELGGRGVGP